MAVKFGSKLKFSGWIALNAMAILLILFSASLFLIEREASFSKERETNTSERNSVCDEPNVGVRGIELPEGRRHVILFCSQIDTESTLRLLELLSERPELDVAFSSRGGSAKDALVVGKALASRKKRVFIFDKCISACANYILAPLSRVFVLDDTFVAFHQTPTSMLEVYASNFGDVDDEAISMTRKLSQAERQFYKQQGVDEKLLTIPLRKLEITCLRAPHRQNGQVTALPAKSKWLLWVPSRRELEEFRNQPLDGWWPSSRAEALKAMPGDLFPADSLFPIRFGAGGDNEGTGSGGAKIPMCK
jgi:hypothetical protein